MFFLYVILIAACTLVDMVLLRIVLAAVKNARYIDHVCTWGEAFWISAALTLVTVVGAFIKGIVDEL